MMELDHSVVEFSLVSQGSLPQTGTYHVRYQWCCGQNHNAITEHPGQWHHDVSWNCGIIFMFYLEEGTLAVVKLPKSLKELSGSHMPTRGMVPRTGDLTGSALIMPLIETIGSPSFTIPCACSYTLWHWKDFHPQAISCHISSRSLSQSNAISSYSVVFSKTRVISSLHLLRKCCHQHS